VGPRADLDEMAKRKYHCLCWDSKPGNPAHSLVSSYTGSFCHIVPEKLDSRFLEAVVI
jgi:hypothetical protein